MKFILTTFLIFFAFNISAQNINGTYTYIPKIDSTSETFEIEISKDSIYVLKSEKNTDDNGKVIRKGNFYYLVSSCLTKIDSLKSIVGLPVKITRNKIKVYGYKPKGKKLTKAFELTKASS